MEPYLAHMVKNKTDKLILQLILKNDGFPISNVRAVTYADFKMETLIDETPLQSKPKDSNNIMYESVIDNANVNYTYAIEWHFKSKSNKMSSLE